jgi:hypothetical protein
MAAKHDTECVVWFPCDICPYRSKSKSTLRRHKADRHNIDVKWHYCEFCKYRCKRKSALKPHLKAHHSVKEGTFEGNDRIIQDGSGGNVRLETAQSPTTLYMFAQQAIKAHGMLDLLSTAS